MDPNEGENTTNHIDKLPAEILRDIFVLAFIRGSSSVSRRWNSLALAEPRLWSIIFIIITWDADDWKKVKNRGTRRADEAQMRRASLWLARSKNAPLDLFISLSNTPEWIHDQVKEIVFPHLHRCQSLVLSFPIMPLIDYPKIWFPLPGMPDLDDLRISGELGSQYFRKALDIGAPPTLRRFGFKSNFSSVLLLNIRVTGELELEGCHRDTILSILEHCTDVKSVTMFCTDVIPSPLSLPLSFPSLRRLNVGTARQFPIQAAPNLRQLRYTGAVDVDLEFLGLRHDVVQILTGLEVLCLDGEKFLSLPMIRNGSFVHSERLKVLKITSCIDPGEVVQYLISPVLPSSSQSHFVAEQPSAQHIAFPGLKLLVIDHRMGGSAIWSESVFGLVQDLLQARSSLTMVCNFRVEGLDSPRLKEFTNLMPNRFILSSSSEIFDRFVKDLDIE